MAGIDYFLDFEIDEEEYIRSCFLDLDIGNPKSSADKKSYNGKRIKPILVTNQAIPLDDIRRSFPKQVEFAWNSFVKQCLVDCFSGFGTDDLLTIVAYPNGNPHGPACREIHGCTATTEYFWTYLMSVPDCLFLVHETKYVIKTDGSVSIVCKFTLTGSRLYLIDVIDVEPAAAKPRCQTELSYTHGLPAEEAIAEADSVTDSLASNEQSSHTSAPVDSNGCSSVAQSKSCASTIKTTPATIATASVLTNKSAPPAIDMEDYLDSYAVQNHALRFRDDFSAKHKYNKYRCFNYSTVGEYVDYTKLLTCEENAVAPAKTTTQKTAQKPTQKPAQKIVATPTPAPILVKVAPVVATSVVPDGKSGGKESSRGRKRCADDGMESSSSDVSAVASLPTDNKLDSEAVGKTPSQRSSASKSEALLPFYTSDDIQVSAPGAQFSLSKILPTAVASNIFGVMRFSVNADKKVHKFELLCDFKKSL